MRCCLFFILFVSYSYSQNKEKIINDFFQCVGSYEIFSSEARACVDAGLKKDSTIAYLWQQKAMPLFKMRKYELGMPFIDNAVKHDKKKYLDYRAFIKCIFEKTYKNAIVDFEKCIQKFGNQYIQDHTYSFYLGLCFLQLNEFEKAESVFKKDIKQQEIKFEEAHYLDLFYYGVSKYEQQKWHEAIVEFDKSLKQYPEFSDVQYYKSICLARLGKDNESALLLAKAKMDAISGYTINEDNIVYEMYPYKVRW